MNTHFVISGISYSEYELRNNSDLGQRYEYVRDIQIFLEQWRGESDSIIAHTSGSTGKPKEIELSKSAMKASAVATAKAFDIEMVHEQTDNKHDVICSPLSAKFIAGKMMIVRALEWKADLICIPPSGNPLAFLDRNIDFMVMTPHQLARSFELGDETKLNQVEKLLLGGSPINKALEDEINSVKTPIFIGYGMTETMSHVALRRLNGKEARNIYEAVDGVSFNLDDRDCLVINAPHLGLSELTTNDVVALLDEYTFSWLGRIDHVINTGGVKVFPELIEGKIESIISQPFYISSQKEKVLGEEVVIVLQGELPDQDTISNWNSQMLAILHKYEMPRKWMSKEEFNYTQTGKVIR